MTETEKKTGISIRINNKKVILIQSLCVLRRKNKIFLVFIIDNANIMLLKGINSTQKDVINALGM